MLAAMRKSQSYDLTATANGPRLQAEVLRRLIADAERTDPARRPLLFGHREWYEAFLERTRLPADARAALRRGSRTRSARTSSSTTGASG